MGFSACRRPPRRLQGAKGALQAELGCLQAEAACAGAPTPRRGGSRPSGTAWLLEQLIRQAWKSKSWVAGSTPGAVLLSNSASKRAHSKRCASSEAPCRSAAAHGLRRLAAAVGDERGWKPALQRDAITTGSTGTRCPSCGRAVARAKRWPSRVVCGNARSGGSIGVRNAGRNGRAAGRWM